jgi:hypothetical protein
MDDLFLHLLQHFCYLDDSSQCRDRSLLTGVLVFDRDGMDGYVYLVFSSPPFGQTLCLLTQAGFRHVLAQPKSTFDV